MGIEAVLGWDNAEFERRVEEYRQRIPTSPGRGYVEAKLKMFHVQPWPLITWLAHNNSGEFMGLLRGYSDYDGAENSRLVLDQLREYCILVRILHDMIKGGVTSPATLFQDIFLRRMIKEGEVG